MRINTNVASLTALEANTNTNKNLGASLEKLSTGLKINKAADDASGLAIADKLRTQASSIGQGIQNANSASALIQIADKAMSEQSTILDTVKSKLIQAGTATTTDAGREAIRKDITKLLSQIDEIAKQTNYNGLTLLQKSSTETSKPDTFTFQLGEEAGFDVSLVQSRATNTVNLGGGSDVFGANSLENGSITAAAIVTANQVGNSIDGSGTQHNNIGTQGSQQLSNTGSVTLTAVDIDGVGAEAPAAAHGVDVTLSGQIGNVMSAGGNAVYRFENQSQELKDWARNIALQDDGDIATGYIWNEDKELLVITDSESLDFGNLEVSNLRVSSSSVDTAASTITSLEINRGGREDAAGQGITSTFTVTNNVGKKLESLSIDDLGVAGQLNVAAASATSQLTGGKLLSEIKDLEVGELTNDRALSYLSVIDEAITQLNANRADFGSSQNQILSSLRSMQTTQVNLKAAESVIRDVDYAAESANFNKQNIVAQAGTYAISQANQVQQNVLRLLQ